MLGFDAFGSSAAMRVAAEGVRSLAILLGRIVAEFVGDTWSGADADRIRAAWDLDVTRPLLLAADKLDGVQLENVLGGGFHG